MAKKKVTKKTKHAIPEGFIAGGISAGIKSGNRADLGVIMSSGPCVAAATMTTNKFKAAPLLLCEKRLKSVRHDIQGVVVNSGNANAMTGDQGVKHARAMVNAAEKATGARTGSFLAASTGIIGVPLPVEKIEAGLPHLANQLSAQGWDDFAAAIMTTDLTKKMHSVQPKDSEGKSRSILGIAKGSGMIKPNMATMLAFIVTDFPLPENQTKVFLAESVNRTFNCVTVDGQTSTNDMVLLLGSNIAKRRRENAAEEHENFKIALTEVCEALSKEIARDGEGATKLITVKVQGTNSFEQARKIGSEIANSPLVKTAVHGCDPNWGRIIQALGQSNVRFLPELASVSIQGHPVVKKGMPVQHNRKKIAKAMETPDVEILIEVGSGKGEATLWTCDLTKGYIDINTAYN